MKGFSIIRQLLSSTLLTLLVLWMAMVISVAWVLKHETDEIFDSSLQETAQRLLPLAVMQLNPHDREEGHTVEMDEDSLEPAQHEEYMVYQVFHASGRMLMRSHSAPSTPLVSDLKPGFQRTSAHLVYVEKSRNGEFLLALAERSSHRTDTQLSTLTFLLLPLLFLLPLSALSMLWITRRASRPLHSLNQEMARRNSADLTPLSLEGLPRELQPLAQTLNQLMGRLKAALEAERNFTTNSAHELRTPLAAAMAQLDVLEPSLAPGEPLQRLHTVRQLLRRLQALSGKLLQLARAESGIAWKLGQVDLGQLLRLLCDDQQWRSDLRLDLSLPSTSVVVQGDVDALGIVLSNLLENAVKYATPGRKIGIELTHSPARIRILNDCDPLPETDLRQLRERFFRARVDVQGAGLGLSIVHALLQPNGIDLSLYSPVSGRDRGFEACLTWPLSVN